ncbi:hypothetical protein N7E81_13630 [Reichenbachiella carrageenanivorans]|uniref:Secreted protein n=1 Tax=Reichenbachiella carrageenanivorans TaxID=2979869 RepID=A0ABY6CWV9_9BACT|nr:hypothetical protein [Reichenbachiella carrageenanivorans]UXX78397.1 hypothetical protein N7E81_13630 [Reichenbachiella carrageenanivorans]
MMGFCSPFATIGSACWVSSTVGSVFLLKIDFRLGVSSFVAVVPAWRTIGLGVAGIDGDEGDAFRDGGVVF